MARILNVVGRRETNAHVVPELVGQLRRKSAPVGAGPQGALEPPKPEIGQLIDWSRRALAGPQIASQRFTSGGAGRNRPGRPWVGAFRCSCT